MSRSFLSDIRLLLHIKYVIPTLALVFVILPFFLYTQGRLIFCDCGIISFWTGEIWSSQNSQQFTDPYSFTHLQHGLIFFVLISLTFRKLKFPLKFLLATSIEVLWEIVENSNYVINIYRQNTASLGYSGDTIINSIGDVIACMIGILVAKLFGIKYAIILFILVGVLMVLTIKDSLLLNVLMIFYPSKAIMNWQLEGVTF